MNNAKNANLLLVESPSKAKTIGKYLGSNFKVLATFGHIRDIPSKTGSVEPDNNFSMHYEINPNAKKHLDAISQFIIDHDSNVNIYLASDPDREGEAIAWHVVEALKLNKKIKMDSLNIKRIVFNAITKETVKAAIKAPREIDYNLVDSQQARRALDYLVGFTISPILWKTVGGLRASAGRVQSVALRLMSEREREIIDFKSDEYWSISGSFQNNDVNLEGNLVILNGKKLEKFSLNNIEKASLAKKSIENQTYAIKEIEAKQQSRNPLPPFTTSTLQQEASKKLGFTSKKTMMVAQKLYEGIKINADTVGLITYMRTDGIYVAENAILETRNLIQESYGPQYLPASERVYKNKVKNAQEAHEAIRPTNVEYIPHVIANHLTQDEFVLYNLIWRRMVASQMSSALYNMTAITISNQNDEIQFRSNFSVMAFDGFNKLYNNEAHEDESLLRIDLTKLKKNDVYNLEKIIEKQHFTEPPARYNEANLIKKMEEIGIGRPSTYATIISILQEREYVTLVNKRFNVTIRGHVITNFLVNFFSKYFAYDFTAKMEEDLDSVAVGEIQWKKLLTDWWSAFYGQTKVVIATDLNEIINTVNNNMKPYLFAHNPDNPEELNDHCPECADGKLYLKFSRYGYFLGCSNYPECKYIKTLSENPLGNINENQQLEKTYEYNGAIAKVKQGKYGPYLEVEKNGEKHNIGLPDKIAKDIEEPMIHRLMALPLMIGTDKKTLEDVKLNLGRYGFYVMCGKNMASVKLEDPFSIDLETAVNLLEKNAEKVLRNSKTIDLGGEIGNITIQKGGFGRLYLKFQENPRLVLPKGAKFDELNLEEIKIVCTKILAKNKRAAKKKK